MSEAAIYRVPAHQTAVERVAELEEGIRRALLAHASGAYTVEACWCTVCIELRPLLGGADFPAGKGRHGAALAARQAAIDRTRAAASTVRYWPPRASGVLDVDAAGGDPSEFVEVGEE